MTTPVVAQLVKAATAGDQALIIVVLTRVFCADPLARWPSWRAEQVST